jgi:hypothetical protein
VKSVRKLEPQPLFSGRDIYDVIYNLDPFDPWRDYFRDPDGEHSSRRSRTRRLSNYLKTRQQAAQKALIDWGPDELLTTAETDVIDYLVTNYSVECPTMHRHRILQLPVEDMDGRDAMHGPHRTRAAIVVPFEGEKGIFWLEASRCPSDSPPLQGEVHDGELYLLWEGTGGTPEAVRQHFDSELDRIQERLEQARCDLESYHDQLHASVLRWVTQRRKELLTNRHLEAGLGFPIHKRADAATYAVPMKRRKIERPQPTTRAPFTPEPALAEADYEAALRVLRNTRNALERSPSMTATLNEERIRDLLLVSLNAQFEGQAAGEVFNGEGKTDILIREQDRNVFIAECKIWRGPKTIRDALDQLLRYLVWRDTKAALLLFVRADDTTAIIGKALSEIENHPNCKRTVGPVAQGERHDFVLHARGDANREIQLAFMPFALGSRKP